MPKIENKERTIFWLKRREKQLSTEVVSQVNMAEQSISYSERRRISAQQEALLEAHRLEIEALKTAIRFIEENSDG